MLKLIWHSLGFYWRSHLGVFLGIVLSTSVLTGALLVGDSADYSLRSFATMRLGDVHSVANTRNHFFKDELARRLNDRLDSPVAAVLHLKGMAIKQGATTAERVQVNQVDILGVDHSFWEFSDEFSLELANTETALSEKLATALGVEVGDEVSLRVAKPSLMSRDAPLSWSGDDRSKRRRYMVKTIVPDAQLGRFSLSPSQLAPYNAFISRAWLQEQVELDRGANLLLVGETSDAETLDNTLRSVWEAGDIGLNVHSDSSGITQLVSERVFFSPESSRAAMTIPNAEATLTYLVNSITFKDKSTPYSFGVAGPVPSDMADNKIVLNRWTADALDVLVGDTIDLSYAELQTNGDFIERSRSFTVHSIAEMESLTTELELMPHFPGLSDVESCSDWDVGMPMDDEKLEDEANEAYWEEYKETPKCFVTLKAGQEMWGNRFGDVTAIRFAGETKADELMGALKEAIDPAKAGLVFLPVREHSLTAVDNAMDFGGLFLGMSFFLILAALLLTTLLFAFGVQQRSTQVGTLLAIGYTPKTIRRLLIGESIGVAIPGVLFGILVSSLYTQGLIYGLSHYWQGAIANASILYHGEASTFILGAIISLFCALCSLYLAIRKQSQHSARDLLSNDFSQSTIESDSRSRGKRIYILSIIACVCAVAIVVFAPMTGSVDLMMPFFSAGSLLLLSGIGFLRHWLILLADRDSKKTLSVRQLAVRNLTLRRGRSLAVAALLACGSFMVFSVAAMQEDLAGKAHLRNSGTGGFSLVADSTIALEENPAESLKNPAVTASLIKVRDGDDASCLNLNRAQSPRVLGVHASDMISREAFGDPDLWEMLGTVESDGTIPALVGDMNTAMFNLMKKAHPEKGAILLFQDEQGNEVRVRLVGALPMRLSVFQGTILVSDEHFTQLYPSESGYRMVLIDAPEEMTNDVAQQLSRSYDRVGLHILPALDRLLEYYAVETTYLAMFLVLGGLGMVIGSIGMGVVVLRNIVERQGELAMLTALGFSAKELYRMLFIEYGSLLFGGLLIGSISAFIATIPALLSTASNVDMRIQLMVLFLVAGVCCLCMNIALKLGLNRDFMDSLRKE